MRSTSDRRPWEIHGSSAFGYTRDPPPSPSYAMDVTVKQAFEFWAGMGKRFVGKCARPAMSLLASPEIGGSSEPHLYGHLKTALAKGQDLPLFTIALIRSLAMAPDAEKLR